VERRQLGSTDLEITRLGFGAWAVGGGGWKFGWGPQDERDSIATIERSLELGMNWIDTAPVYGVGVSEEVVGKAIKGRADQPLVFTKCGLLGDRAGTVTNTLAPDSIRAEVDESLRRLGVDVIDLYQIHWPDPDHEIEAAWETLAELRDVGKVRNIGVSNCTVPQLERLQAISPIASLQPPLSIVRPETVSELLPYCGQQGIGVIVYSPMHSGLLSGGMTHEKVAAMPDDDWRRTEVQFQEPQLSRNLLLVDLLREIGEEHQVGPGAISIAWTLSHPEVTAAIVGPRRPDQPDALVAAADLELSAEQLTRIEEFMATPVPSLH